MALVVAFVFHSFRPEHPLIDLRLFKNRELTVSIITMFLFVAAFFGGLLLVPTYFQQVRGESALMAGLLVAPQGIGAMLTMPIAGTLSDRLPVGRIVPVGLVVIIIGMFGLTQVTEDTSYTLLIAELFVLGLGMGATMMPLFTSALKTLKAHEVARGSTLLNINQQIGSSVGVAVISVILTAHLNASDLAKPAMAATLDPNLTDAVGGAAAVAAGLADAAAAFADTFWVAWVLVALTLVPAFFLPRKHVESELTDEELPRACPRRHALTLASTTLDGALQPSREGRLARSARPAERDSATRRARSCARTSGTYGGRAGGAQVAGGEGEGPAGHDLVVDEQHLGAVEGAARRARAARRSGGSPRPRAGRS